MKKTLKDKKQHWLEEDELPAERSIWLRIVALITATFFIGMIILPLWTVFNLKTPLADLVTESLHLKKKVDNDLLDAVVKIEVVSRKSGSAVAVGQKSSTGFNVDNGGLIVTNHHVLADAHNITVTFPCGKKYSAKKWASKPEYDLAVIELESANLPAVSLNVNNPPVSGDRLMVIGNPMHLDNIMVEGQLKQYVLVKDKPCAMLCIDVPIYPGNSGSPVCDVDGRVVGVVFGNLRIEEEGNEKFYGLAIPIKEVLTLLE